MKPKNKAAAQLGKLGGKSKSNAKQDAARINGAKGGRPRKERDGTTEPSAGVRGQSEGPQSLP
jgi:hypothetical protein